MGKDKYNFKINPSTPSSAEIRRHQDFDALLQQFLELEPARPPAGNRMRRLGMWSAVAAAAATIALVIYFQVFDTPSYESRQMAFFASQPFVEAPLQDLDKPFQSKIISGNKGGVVEFGEGSRIEFPPNAFQAGGQAVQGEVEIKYREFRDFVDFFMAGIPMTYDSAGHRYHLESAGMLEVYAEKDGSPVSLKEDKELNIVLVSEIHVPATYNIPSFNIYKLDRGQRNWIYHGKDDISLLRPEEAEQARQLNSNPEMYLQSQLDAELARINEEIDRKMQRFEGTLPVLEKPVPPAAPQPQAVSFDFDLAEDQSHRLQLYLLDVFAPNDPQEREQRIRELKKGVWQLSAQNTYAFDETQLAEEEWVSIQLQQKDRYEFELRLISNDKEVRALVNPVLPDHRYREALAGYEAAIEQYELKLNSQKELLKGKRLEFERLAAKERQQITADYTSKMEAYKQRGPEFLESEYVKTKVVNRFAIKSLGIWNCDRPVDLSSGNIKGRVVQEGKNKVSGQVAFVVNKTTNTLQRHYVDDDLRLAYSPDDDYLLWMVTPENQLAVCRPESFERIAERTQRAVFVVELVEEDIRSEEDLRKVLYF